MKVYSGYRSSHGCVVTVDDSPLDPRLDIHAHSGGEFEWGYEGSGPTQLALAIMAEHFGNATAALNSYKLFRDMVIANLRDDQWTLDDARIKEILGSSTVVPMTLEQLLNKVRGIE
jgi:hypothetical protein